MLVQTKRRFVIYLDEDEAELFLDDATALQARVREQLKSGNGHAAPKLKLAATQNLAPSRSLAKQISAPTLFKAKPGRKATAVPKATRRAMKRVTCPDCHKSLPAHWLERHRAKHHGSALSVFVQDVPDASAV